MIEKSVPRDLCHHSENLVMLDGDPPDRLFYPALTQMIDSYSLGKPRDSKRQSSGRFFLSYPQTHDKFLYSTFVFIIFCIPSMHYCMVCDKSGDYFLEKFAHLLAKHLIELCLMRGIKSYKNVNSKKILLIFLTEINTF